MKIKLKGNESLPQNLIFNSYIFAMKCRRPVKTFLRILFDKKNLILKYKLSFTSSGLKDIGTRKFEFVTKTHEFLNDCFQRF